MKKIKVIALVCVIMLFGGGIAYCIHISREVAKLSDFLEENFGMPIESTTSAKDEIHEIYDDTKVIKAYKTGDDTRLNDKDKYILREAKKIIKENIKEDMTDYEKELAIYNWQTKYVNYDEGDLAAIPEGEDNSHNPYGVLKSHVAICVGNATTFKLFMDMLGIDCKIIHSTENGEHAWDLVKIDGDWYHTDVTFDTLINDKPTYATFNITDNAKLDAGDDVDDGDDDDSTDEEGSVYTWDLDKFPKATSTKYCYALNHSIKLKSIYELPQVIKNALNKKKSVLYVTVKNFTGSMDDVVSRIARSVSDMAVMYDEGIALDDKTKIYVITLSENNLDKLLDKNKDVNMDKLQDKIDDVFGS